MHDVVPTHILRNAGKGVFMKHYISASLLLVITAFAAADSLPDELQWLAVQTACIGQYNNAQTGDYTLSDPTDYYKPSDIREYLTKMSGDRTRITMFYGICFDYAQAAYEDILKYESHYEKLGMKKNGWFIAAAMDNSRQITLYDPVSKEQADVVMNGVPLKGISRQNVQAHGDAIWHAWLWVFADDGTVYWIDPTWTDNAGYVWWGIVQDGKEVQLRPLENLCMTTLPNDAAFAAYNSGNANKNKGLYDQAIADYTAALRSDPNNADAYNNRGVAYKKKGDYDKAIADYNQALRINPNDAIVYSNRGNVYSDKGDYDKAIADYNQALKIDPNNATFYYNRAVTYVNKGDCDRAIADYNQALKIDPNYASVYTSRGLAYQAKGDIDRAMADYNQAIRANPNDDLAYFNRGNVYYIKGDYDKAIAEYNQVIRINPNLAAAYTNRGLTYSGKGDYDRAIADHNQAIRLEPNDAVAYLNRGVAYYRKGDRDRARADWRKALELDPNNETARSHLENF
jgi:tetratricopeptide (TPR) repeat protein